MQRWRVRQLALSLTIAPDHLADELARRLNLAPSEIRDIRLEKRSVDARDKGDIRLVWGLSFALEGKTLKSPLVESVAEDVPFTLPRATRTFASRPVVVGAGPAGLFCALALAEAGLKPLLLERGDSVENRRKAVDAFMKGGELDPDSNIQFGEGGAGTWSDGKLTTQVKDEKGRARKVLEEFIRAGAPAEIGWEAKPHLGTDSLVRVVAGLRHRIEALGGEVRFRSRVDAIRVRDGAVAGVTVNGAGEIDTEVVVLALGHSARDSFAMLSELGIEMERKPFAIGLRVEHPQEMISESQYGKLWRHPALPVADYKLTGKTSDGRGVYSFCMCPGGLVVNASSERGHVVCNGMSNLARNGKNANAAIVVAVNPEDFGGPDLMAGVEFQRRWEKAACAASGSGSLLPVQTLGDFVERRRSTALGKVKPDATSGFSLSELHSCLPPFVSKGITEAVPRFGRMIKGFDRSDAVLTGVETRTSSPLRVLRGEDGQASIRGIYPVGEGAGYAGGIMSAAMDGLRAAEWILLSPGR